MKALDYLGFVLGVVGLFVLIYFDYRIAIGVFLMLWGNNLQNRI